MLEKKLNYKEKFKNFYNSKAWKDLRAYKFSEANGLCEKCGKITSGKDVHHKIPIEKDWNLRLDYNNLILLCKDCHNEQHGRESELQKFLKKWETM